MSPLLLGNWYAVRDGDPRAKGIQMRHYSTRRYQDGRRPLKIVGSGEYLLLMTQDCQALFGWQLSTKTRRDGQEGVACFIFRNEGLLRSSDLIREADALAWDRWPGRRHFTYVNPLKIASPNPGYCFKKAGWHFTGTIKGGLHILEVLP